MRELGIDAAVFESSKRAKRPKPERCDRCLEFFHVSVTALAMLDAGDQFGEDRNADAEGVTVRDFGACPLKDAVPPVDVVAGNVRVEEEASHSHSLPKLECG
jgi:hypothetical protein